MLKRFSLENFSSFKLKNYLDLTADNTEIHSNHICDFKKVKILKSAIIYGANASGKSNLIKALNYAKDIVSLGLDNVETYKKYFRLDKESINKPTIFEFELEIDNKFYSFGFSSLLSEKKIIEEWLYEIGRKVPEKIYERINNEITIGKSLEKNKDIKKRFEIYIDDMKNQANQLFLSEISNKNLDFKEIVIINNIFNWFDEKLIILYPHTEFGGKAFLNKNENLVKIFCEYLNKFDTGIINISSIEENFEDSLKHLPEKIKKQIEKDVLNKKTKRISIGDSKGGLYTIYKNDNNELKVQKLGLIHSEEVDEIFELSDESDGTRRLFDLIPLIRMFSKDFTIVIDEFDRSLHPNLTKKFFELFYNLNKNKTQLIVSTHESTLLDLQLVRRDELWFVKKDKKGASQTYPLNQFNLRHDKKIDKDYLMGRFDAIPMIDIYDEINMEI